MPPYFSIVIPTYNRAERIKRSIESVLAQTFNDWELIIVDDGSTDKTKEVVKGYKDERIKYIYQQNAERSAARNNGVANSIGKYICFLDSDDYYLSSRLELLHKQITAQNEPVAVFYTGIAYDHNGKISDRPELENTYSKLCDFIALATIGNPQACAHRSILSEFQFDPRFHIGEDMELWLRVCTKYTFIYLNNQFTVVAVEHDERSVNVARYNSFTDQLRMLRDVFSSDHPGKNVSPEIQSFLLANCFYGIAKFYIYQNRRMKAVPPMIRAVLTDSNSKQLKFRINVLLKLITFTSMDAVKELIRF